MGIFDYFRKKKIDNIVDAVKKKNIGKRYLMLLLGCLIVAFSFNLFWYIYFILIEFSFIQFSITFFVSSFSETFPIFKLKLDKKRYTRQCNVKAAGFRPWLDSIN